MTVADRLRILRNERAVMLDYLYLVADREDWHGVMDAAADLREVDTEIAVLEKLTARGASDLRLDAIACESTEPPPRSSPMDEARDPFAVAPRPPRDTEV